MVDLIFQFFLIIFCCLSHIYIQTILPESDQTPPSLIKPYDLSDDEEEEKENEDEKEKEEENGGWF